LTQAKRRQMKLRLVAVGFMGALLSFFGRMVTPRPVLEKLLEPKQAPWIALAQRFWDLLGSVEGSIAVFGIFALLAAYRRYRQGAWYYAFVAGVFLEGALFR
jgi:hypothetical protein